MKTMFNTLFVCLIANLTFAQQLDESGNFSPFATDFTIKSQEQALSGSSTPPDIINTIPSPSVQTHDIAFDGANLWMASSQSGTIYKIAPTDGTVLKSLSVNSTYISGLTFDGNNLWVADRANQRILQIDTLAGTILQEFPINNNGANGLAWANGDIWHNNNRQGGPAGDTTFNISSTSGVILDWFLPFDEQPTGLTFDGTYLWSSDNNIDVIFKIDINTYSIVETIDAPGGEFPNGLAFDGQYLWVSNNDADSIYQLDIGFMPTDLNDLSITSSDLLVYPNPSAGTFVFEYDFTGNDEDLQLKVFDTQGKTLLNQAFNNKMTLDLNEFKDGVFFYTLTDNGKMLESGKLIKKE